MVNKDIEEWYYAGVFRDESFGPTVKKGPRRKGEYDRKKWLCHRPRA